MKQNKGISQIVIMVIMLVLAIALPITTKLVQKSQENRSKATDQCLGLIGNGCETNPDCLWNDVVKSCTAKPACTSYISAGLETCEQNNCKWDDVVKTCVAKPSTPTCASYTSAGLYTCELNSNCKWNDTVKTCETKPSTSTGNGGSTVDDDCKNDVDCESYKICDINTKKCKDSYVNYDCERDTQCPSNMKCLLPSKKCGVPNSTNGGVPDSGSTVVTKQEPTCKEKFDAPREKYAVDCNGTNDRCESLASSKGYSSGTCKSDCSCEYKFWFYDGSTCTEKIKDSSYKGATCLATLGCYNSEASCNAAANNVCTSGTLFTDLRWSFNGKECVNVPAGNHCKGCGTGTTTCYTEKSGCESVDRLTTTAPPTTSTTTTTTDNTPVINPPAETPAASVTPVAKVSFKLAFAGIKPSAVCLSSLGNLKVEVANIPTNSYQGSLTTAVTPISGSVDSKGNQIFKVDGLVLDTKFSNVNNSNYIKLKGPFHVKRRMCLDNQSTKLGENTDCVLDLTTEDNRIYDFSKYTLLSGDINGDGVINSIDFSTLKTNMTSKIECGQRGDLDLNGRVNSIDADLIKDSLSSRDDE